MIEIIFTIKRHKELAVQTHTARDFPVIWFVPEEEFDSFGQVPEGVTLRKTNFPRGGNLRGKNFLAGYIKLLHEFREEVIIKRDSDTIVSNPNIFKMKEC